MNREKPPGMEGQPPPGMPPPGEEGMEGEAPPPAMPPSEGPEGEEDVLAQEAPGNLPTEADSGKKKPPTPDEAVEGMQKKELNYQQVKNIRSHYKTLNKKTKCMKCGHTPCSCKSVKSVKDMEESEEGEEEEEKDLDGDTESKEERDPEDVPGYEEEQYTKHSNKDGSLSRPEKSIVEEARGFLREIAEMEKVDDPEMIRKKAFLHAHNLLKISSSIGSIGEGGKDMEGEEGDEEKGMDSEEKGNLGIGDSGKLEPGDEENHQGSDKVRHPHRELVSHAADFLRKLSDERALGHPHKVEAARIDTALGRIFESNPIDEHLGKEGKEDESEDNDTEVMEGKEKKPKKKPKEAKEAVGSIDEKSMDTLRSNFVKQNLEMLELTKKLNALNGSLN